MAKNIRGWLVSRIKRTVNRADPTLIVTYDLSLGDGLHLTVVDSCWSYMVYGRDTAITVESSANMERLLRVIGAPTLAEIDRIMDTGDPVNR